jgi:hypothetical protein
MSRSHSDGNLIAGGPVLNPLVKLGLPGAPVDNLRRGPLSTTRFVVRTPLTDRRSFVIL